MTVLLSVRQRAKQSQLWSLFFSQYFLLDLIVRDDAMGLTRREEEKVKHAVTEALTALCVNTLFYESQFTVEGLLGITLDNTDVILVKVDETVRGQPKAGHRNTRHRNAGSQDSNSKGDGETGKSKSRGRGGRSRSTAAGRKPHADNRKKAAPESARKVRLICFYQT